LRLLLLLLLLLRTIIIDYLAKKLLQIKNAQQSKTALETIIITITITTTTTDTITAATTTAAATATTTMMSKSYDVHSHHCKIVLSLRDLVSGFLSVCLIVAFAMMLSKACGGTGIWIGGNGFP
jgi:hypothetical protein